jgi:hypothetical protein
MLPQVQQKAYVSSSNNEAISSDPTTTHNPKSKTIQRTRN